MTARTHLVGGGLSAAILLEASINADFGLSPVTVKDAAIIVVLAIIGSVFPDIDLNNSRLGSTFAIISKFINKVFGHRTFFHSPLLYITPVVLSSYYFPMAYIPLLGFSVGAMSHIILDYFNRAGVPLFWPVPMRFWFPAYIKTGSRAEMLFQGILWTLLVITVCQTVYHIFEGGVVL